MLTSIWNLLITTFHVSAIGLAAYMIYLEYRFSRWPRVRGIVTRSTITTRDIRSIDEERKIFRPTIRYKYQVNGQSYVGRWVHHHSKKFPLLNENREMDRAKATKSAGRFPVGTEVEIIYNPADPAEAFLKSGWGWIPIVILVAFSCFLYVDLWSFGLVPWVFPGAG